MNSSRSANSPPTAPEIQVALRSVCGPEGLEIIAIDADRPEGGDGVPVPDWWTD